MRRCSMIVVLLAMASTASGQLSSLETENLNLVYFGTERFLAPHLARCFENALQSHMRTFEYTPSGQVTLFLHDFGDTGNAGATAIPNNRLLVTIAPFFYSFEVVLGNERMNWLMSHELVHILAGDAAAKRDRFYRSLFGGKVAPVSANPLSLIYSYLTTPRFYAPRWWHEGGAVFMETWSTGGLGRAMGGYDEMVFRAKVAEDAPIYDIVGLESAASKLDFQVGFNAYLYGTRFFSYMAAHHGAEKVVEWIARKEDSKPGYAAQFSHVFGMPIDQAWDEWTEWERGFQRGNLDRLAENPITSFRPVSHRPLGSVSRAIVDRDSRTIYLGVHYPGRVAHLAALDIDTGELERICDVKGPALYYVTSLAWDPASRTLFYTTDNNDWRDLRAIDLATGKSTVLMKDARVGDLAFNQDDRSLWGVRHYNGISTLVRIPHPYTEWNQIHSFPYGSDLYDLDVSPDGQQIVAALTKISGSQSLVRFATDKLMAGDPSYDVLSEFENSSPATFVFSPDGRFLYGSSYYSGVSNIYRCDLETNEIVPMTNADTGYFRPVPLDDDELIAFRYTADGFLPVAIAPEPVAKVNAISFLGQQVVEHHPVVTEWKLPPPSTVELEPLIVREGDYSPFATFGLRSVFPMVEGYKDAVGIGARLAFADSVGYNRMEMSASYSPSSSVPSDERFHFKATYKYLNWEVEGIYNMADFYDLFGPTKRSRKGYGVGAEYRRYLIFDQPHRSLDWSASLAGYGNLETLPGNQNVASSAKELAVADLSIGYKHVRSSLGAVEAEKGLEWRATVTDNYGRGRHFPRLRMDLDLGLPLPISHSSVWLRTSGGVANGDHDEPFANFYFGGFGNNWVDDKAFRRYRDWSHFPGVEIDEIGGNNYVKAMVEWNLPPLIFTNVGSPSFFVNWASLALFGGGVTTNLGKDEHRREVTNLGAQLDLRFVVLANHQFTLSLGYARAFEEGFEDSDEVMVSLRLPVYD